MNKRKRLLENRKQFDLAMAERNQINSRRQEISDERDRVFRTLQRAPDILDDIDEEFARQTKLRKKDVVLLFTATALQVIRQYVLRNRFVIDRPNEKVAAKEAYSNGGMLNSIEQRKGWDSSNFESIERGKKYYHPTLEEIITNPVPFDTQVNSGYEGFNLHLIGKNTGLGGPRNHRLTTLGHDPILGLIFGTANIATRTVTVSNLQTFHVQYGLPNNLRKKGKPFEKYGDYFSERADTFKTLKYGLVDPIQSRNSEKLEILVCSLIKELIHLKSDINSKESLPLPFMTLTPELAKRMSNDGIDMANILALLKNTARQAVASVTINVIIELVHAIIFDEKKDGNRDLYRVRTHKIVKYSNLLATSSNVIEVGVKAAWKKDYKGAIESLDLGGMMVTVAELFRDIKFVSKVKEEFLRNKWEQTVMGDFS